MSSSSTSSSPRTSLWQEREWWFAIGGCCIVLAVNLVRPLIWDNALYQSIAWEWVRYGRMPYVGTFDQNFPGVIYFHAISILLFGTSEFGFRVLETSLHLLEAMGIYLLVRRSHKPLTALTAALLSCEVYLPGESVGQRDAFAVVVLVFATILYFRINDRPLTTGKQIFLAVAAGLLMGLMILLRPTYALCTLWLGAVMLLTLERGRWLTASAYSFGVIAAIVIAFSPYLAMPGMLGSLYTDLIRFNTEVYGATKYRRSPWEPTVWKHWLVFFIAVAFALFVWLRKRVSGTEKTNGKRNPELLLIAGYLVGAFVSIMWMGKFFRYHFEPLYQFSFILLVVTIERYFQRNDKYRTIACIGLILVGLIVFYPWRVAKFYYKAIAANAPDRLAFVASEDFPDSLSGYRRQVELASYIRSKSKPTDRVEFACMDPRLFYLTGLEPSSQFTSLLHIMVSKPDGSFPLYEQKWRQEFVDSIRVIRPIFFVTALGPDGGFFQNAPYRALEGIPGYKEMLNANYSLDTTIGYWLVYRAKPLNAH